jgi:hypothetical protein
MLKIYIIGVLVCFLLGLLMEHFYFGNGRSETVTLEMIGADFLYSLLSWIGVLGEVIMFASEWYCGFDQMGVGENLYDYEEKLKREQEEKENATE